MNKERPATCYTCGAEVPETPRFGNEATCDECARTGRKPREKDDDGRPAYAEARDYRDGLE